MIKLVEKAIQKIQLKDICVQYICEFYEKRENRKTVILIYDEDIYLTNISYEEIMSKVV